MNREEIRKKVEELLKPDLLSVLGETITPEDHENQVVTVDLSDPEKRVINIDVEKLVNSTGDKYFLSKEQKENMYLNILGIPKEAGEVLFDDKNRITGFRPHQACKSVSITLNVSEKGIEIV